ncbi:hypothetical protein [Diaminobutyricibacter sp. McL0608]|uniref:hypothetical protein n=1 Tax=Leifsonia sp. McL0608 TaxID=3143537 RepID=UPI0031F30BA8
MYSVRRHLAVPLAILLALGLAPAVSGCANVEGIVKNVTGGHVDIGGNKVPSDFPSAVPLYKGDIVFGASVGGDDKKVWNVTVKVPDATASADIEKQLTDAGFTGSFKGADGDANTGTFTSDAYGVLVVVTSAGKNGWVANYTVTTASVLSPSPTPTS